MARILVDIDSPLPPGIQALIIQLMDTPRDPVSPNAAYAVENARLARSGGEERSKRILNKGIALEDLIEGDHNFSTCHPNVHLSVDYIDSKLKQPQPDVGHGYLPSYSRPGAAVPFTKDEEDCIYNKSVRNVRTNQHVSMDIAPWVLFPYFTIQWKSHDAIWKANAQGARDGAAINEHLRCVFSAAQGQLPENTVEPAVLDTLHISATFEGYHIFLWVHYYDQFSSQYLMKEVEEFQLKDQEHMARYRRFLRNWEDYAMGPRLQAIKGALNAIRAADAPPAGQGAAEPQAAEPNVAASAARRGPGRPRKTPYPAPPEPLRRSMRRRDPNS